jgi:outer membrane protein OmpA-like peptidoglycan-associated protein
VTARGLGLSAALEVPKVEIPKIEIPKLEVPKIEIPKLEVPKVEIPKLEISKVEIPKIAIPKVEIPKLEVPKVEIPKVVIPKMETTKGKLQKAGTQEPDKIFTKVEAFAEAELAPTMVDAKPVAAGSSRSNWWLPIMALALLGMGAIFYKIMENRKAAVPTGSEVTAILPDATLKPIESVNAPTEPPPITTNSMADAGTSAKPGDYNTKVIPKGASTTVATPTAPSATAGLESKGGVATNAVAAKPAVKTSGSSTRGGGEAGAAAKTTTGTVVARGKAAGIAPGKLNWLLFDFDKSDLRSQSMSELDKLAAVLKKNTTAKAELDGHTDFKGGEDYNNRLSEHRAENAKKYLISKGIPEDRIVLKTHGKSNPYTENKTDEGRQLNRRVEIRAIDASGNAIETSVAPKSGANQK